MGPYDILEISSRATEEEIRTAYKAMAKKWHPDRMLDDQETATRKFMDISCAYRAILRERRRDTRQHSSSSSSSSSAQHKSPSASSLRADRPHGWHHSSRSSSPQKCHKDSTRPACSKERTTSDIGDTSRDNRRYKKEADSSNKSNLEGSKSSSRLDKSSRLDQTRSSRSRSSREPSPSSSSSSRSSSTSRSSKSSSSSSTSSYKSGSSTENLSSASSRTSVRSSSTDSLPDQGRGPNHEAHYPRHRPPTSANSDSTPSFTSYTSSEVSAYDTPEIAPPGASRNEKGSKFNVPDKNNASRGPPPPRPPDGASRASSSSSSAAKSGSGSRREKGDHHSSCTKMRRGEGERDHEERTLIPEYDSPLARAVGVSKEWTYTIRLTLEELFYGKKLRFRVLRCKLDGKRKTVILDVDVPPGSEHGTQLIFRGAGHERKDGTRQDIVFIIEEAKHERFVRVKDDLMLDVRLPWVDSLRKEAGVVYARGLDGKESMFEVDFAREGDVAGTMVVPGAGMPVPGTDRRGKLVVRWEIYMPSGTSRWGTLKQVLSL